MGRKRKLKRRARKAESSEERAEQEMAGEEVEEDSTTNPPPVAADECEEEAIEGLLEPFSRDELLDLLAEACFRDPALLSRLASPAASDTAHRRFFVHGLGPGATTAALAAAFAPFGTLDECHAVADRATGCCRGYGFVTFRRGSTGRRALADASNRVGGRPVACQLASIGPAIPSPDRADRKLFVEEHRVIKKKKHRVIKKKKHRVINGCELQCRRAHRVIKKKKHATAATNEDAGGQSNGAGAAALPPVQRKELALTSATQPPLGSNPMVGLMAKGISSATVLSYQNAGAGGAGLLGASPSATAHGCALFAGSEHTE